MHFHNWLCWTTLLIKKTSVCKITAVLYFWQLPQFWRMKSPAIESLLFEKYMCGGNTSCLQSNNDGQNHHPTQPEKPVNIQAIRAQPGWRLSQIIRLVLDIMKEIKKIQNCLEQNHKGIKNSNASSPTDCCLLHWWHWGRRIPPFGRLPHWGASTDVVIVFASFETIYNTYFFRL